MPATTFIESQFPVYISKGSTGGPGWLTEVVEKVSGFEERNSPWTMPRYRYDAKYGVRTLDELHDVLSVYQNARGRLRGFRYKDWSDFESCKPSLASTALDQSLGTGTGAATVFNLNKRYSFGAEVFDRRISKPVSGTVKVAVNGTEIFSGFTVDTVAGTVTFTAAPSNGAVLTWGGEFDVPVRFDSDNLDLTLRGPIGDIPSIPLLELRQ